MKNKIGIVLALTFLSLGACRKKPDAPAPLSQPPTQGQPPPPPPVSQCQGGTIMYSMPVDTMTSGTIKSFVIPNFEVSCGDTLQVFIKNIALAPTDPWTELFDNPQTSSYYSLLNQTITVHNNTSDTVYVEIQAVLH